jgi:ankyrin repeat protein
MSLDFISGIESGQTHKIIPYLKAGGNPAHLNSNGVSLLQWCAYHGDATAVLTLIGAGAPAIQLGENLDLNGAVFHGHVTLVECLIELGADVNYPLADTGETPLHAALCKTGDRRFDAIVKRLLEEKADPNAMTRPGVATGAFMRDARTRGETPLHRAGAFGSASVIKALVDAGAKFDARDVNGDSPLSWASWSLRPRGILQLLCFPPHQVRDHLD